MAIYYIFRLFAAILPFVMIRTSFIFTLILIFVAQVIPFATPVLWIWGLWGAITGPQDFFAYCYYVIFAFIFFPLIFSLIKGLFRKS